MNDDWEVVEMALLGAPSSQRNPGFLALARLRSWTEALEQQIEGMEQAIESMGEELKRHQESGAARRRTPDVNPNPPSADNAAPEK